METLKPQPEANVHSEPTTGYVEVPNSNVETDRPPLPRQGSSERSRPQWGTTVMPVLSQSASVRTLFRLTSVGQDYLATNDPPPEQHAGGSRGHPTAAASMPMVLRAAMLFKKKQAAIERFRCYICFDDAPVTGAVTLSTCSHRYCQACFTSYLGSKINEGNIHPVCFHPIEASTGVTDVENPAEASQTTCGVSVSEDQIKASVDADAWAKFERFRFNEEHTHARECPYCALSQECVGPAQPSCICIGCEKLFCFFHGNAHENGTCADYELKNAEAESLSRAVINELAKPCPGCTRDIEKNGGCNHMRCVACATSFCWLCSEIIEDVPKPSHFDPTKEGGCSGKQFDPIAARERTWWQYLLFLVAIPLMCPLALIATPFLGCSTMRGWTMADIFVVALYRLVLFFEAIYSPLLTIPFAILDAALGLAILVICGVGFLIVMAFVGIYELFCG